MAQFDSDCYYEYPPRDPQPPYVPHDVNFQADYYCGSSKIIHLDMTNFDIFIDHKEKALVLFYNSDLCHAHGPEKELAELANNAKNHKYGFGAVDCSIDGPVCTRERSCQTPIFKLYSNGYEVSSIKDASSITADLLGKLVKMTPVLRKSRGDIGYRRAIQPDPRSPEEAKGGR